MLNTLRVAALYSYFVKFEHFKRQNFSSSASKVFTTNLVAFPLYMVTFGVLLVIWFSQDNFNNDISTWVIIFLLLTVEEYFVKILCREGVLYKEIILRYQSVTDKERLFIKAQVWLLDIVLILSVFALALYFRNENFNN